MNTRFGANEIVTEGPKTERAMSDIPIEPTDCALLADQQDGLAFGVHRSIAKCF
ncbi:hypothetical protein [Bradyrhizobium sp. 23AC]